MERALDALPTSDAAAPVPPATSASSTGALVPPPADLAKTVAVGADHGGFLLKQVLVKALTEKGFGVTDCGTASTNAVDYPDFAHVVARLVYPGMHTPDSLGPIRRFA